MNARLGGPRGTPRARNIRPCMDLEPRTIEKVGERCEECGVRLTPQELQTVLETGGPVLCTVHATEAKPLILGDEEAGEADPGL